MLFSSTVFLFLFLPLTLLLVFFSPSKLKNLILLVISLFFYTWGEGKYLILLLFSISFNYFIGIWIERYNVHSKLFLVIGVVFNISLLSFFKYLGFFGQNLSGIFPLLEEYSWFYNHIHLPLGISFFTFQSLSYIIDVYQKNTTSQKSFVNYALLIALFPHQIAGPIIRYKDIESQLTKRTLNSEAFSRGCEIFMIGLSKKMLLANNLAIAADSIFAFTPDQLSTPLCWLGIICYSLQLYYDFSGYSDMAIGLGSMLGFHFLENFNYPYFAQSIQDFWRRWHISLSSWFRDYVYIPLGGNRKGEFRTYINLFVVFLLTGFWHGASWSFVIWGVFHGFFIAIERLFLSKILEKSFKVIKHTYTILIVLIGWVIFRSVDLNYAGTYIQKMFLYENNNHAYSEFVYLINNELIMSIFAAIIFAFPWSLKMVTSKFRFSISVNLQKAIFTIFVFSCFILSILYLTANTYNPFIYFRF